MQSKTSKTHTFLKVGTATVENSMEASQNLKIEVSHDPAIIPLLGIYHKELKTGF